MNLRLKILGRVFPERARRRMLDELAATTAAAFGVKRPRWSGGAFAERLAEYAAFTAREADTVLGDGDDVAVAATKERLRRGAERMGASTRRRLGVRDREQALEALVLLYRQIGVEMRVAEEVPAGWGAPGVAAARAVDVRRCFFADHYSERVCELIGSLDRGLVSGLFAGAEFDFETRITAGEPCCRAWLRPAAAQQ